MKKLMIRK